jgi:hypothetical protein
MSADLEPLTRESFAPHVGSHFAVAAFSGGLDLTLSSIGPAGAGLPGKRIPFALHFHGPAGPLLRQGVYRLRHEAFGDLEIFLVPLGPQADGTVYEAIFS